MGVTGATRAASKVAGISAPNGGISFTTGARVFAAWRNGLENEDSVPEFDDWELAGEEEFTGKSTARTIFGEKPPTLQEAQEACSDLSDVLQMMYLSPNSAGWTGSLVSDEKSGSQLLSDYENLETKVCDTFSAETVAFPRLSKEAHPAFVRFIQCPDFQNVVASIASDEKVLNVVMQNPEVDEFLKSCYKNEYTWENDENAADKEEYVADNGFKGDQTPNGFDNDENAADNAFKAEQTPKGFEESSDDNESRSSRWFKRPFKKVKTKVKMAVVDMMSKLSNYFGSFFGGSVEQTSKGDEKSSDYIVVGALVMAIMVMIIVLIKRKA